MSHPTGSTPTLPREGVDLCACGAKYWDGDRCHSCGDVFAPEVPAWKSALDCALGDLVSAAQACDPALGAPDHLSPIHPLIQEALDVVDLLVGKIDRGEV